VRPAVIAIFGPTGVGKTAIALALGRRLRAAGEDPVAVSADALQVYRGLEVLTGAPPAAERAQLEHRMVSFLPVDARFSVGEYAELVHAEIDSLLDAGRRPIVVGGTGLYLRAALADLDLRPPPPPGARERWEAEVAARGAPGLHAVLAERAPWAAEAIDPHDRQRIGFRMATPASLQPGDYLGAMVASLDAGQTTNGLTVQTRAALLVKVTVPGVLAPRLTVGRLRAHKVDGGEAFDVVIAPPAALEEFAGKVTADRASLGRVGLGVAVRPGAAVPDISSSEALKRSVLQADSIVFNRASSGIYFENLLKKMEIYDKVQAKTTRYADGAAVMEHVLKGKGREIGFGPVTEILQHREKGLKLVGPLPPEVQNYTSYSAAPMTAAASAELARVFVRYLGSPESKALFVAAGID